MSIDKMALAYIRMWLSIQILVMFTSGNNQSNMFSKFQLNYKFYQLLFVLEHLCLAELNLEIY